MLIFGHPFMMAEVSRSVKGGKAHQGLPKALVMMYKEKTWVTMFTISDNEATFSLTLC